MDIIWIPTNKGAKAIMLKNIIRIEANSNYSIIYFNSGYPLTVAKVLQWFETRLPQNVFLRIHRAHLVNSTHIYEIKTGNKLQLSNGEFLQASRRKSKLCQNLKRA